MSSFEEKNSTEVDVSVGLKSYVTDPVNLSCSDLLSVRKKGDI
jgi:hypothetical protein